MAIRSFAVQQAEQEAERLARDIMRAFQRAARATDRSSSRMSRGAGGRRGGGRMPISGRARRAPTSASQFHLHVKKSKSSGVGRAPVSCVGKIKYDMGLGENDPYQDRVKAAFVSAPAGTPAAARDPLRMAEACFERARRSKYANANTGQMLHIDSALPNSLSPDRLAQLSGDINQKISDRFGVPAFSGVHLDYGNHHIHASVPLHEVLDDGEGGFTLGDRIDHTKRPSEREALGLPRSPAGELRELRQDIAGLIADAVRDEHPDDPHMAERWKHGHQTLSTQVEEAAKRGDVAFVLENISRDATKKEGPPPSAWRAAPSNARRDAAVEHNRSAGKPSSVPAPELITKTLVNRLIDLAQKAQIDTPEGFRMLARVHGLHIHWALSKEGKGVQGVTFSVQGGPRIAGRRLGASLGVLQKKMRWAEKPEYQRFPPKRGDEFDAYMKRVTDAGIRPTDLSNNAIKITLQRLEKLEKQAQEEAAKAEAAAPVESGPIGPHEVKSPRLRPKRKSNDPSFNKKAPAQAAPTGRTPASGQAKPASTTTKDKSMNVDNLLRELQTIPEPHVVPKSVVVALHKRPQQPHVGAGAAKAPPRALPDPATLTSEQRWLIAHAWDTQQAQRSGAFDGPLTRANERLKRQLDDLRKRLNAEPWPEEEPRKRFLRGTVMVETADHREWREGLVAGRDRAAELEMQIKEMINKAVQAPALLGALPELEVKRAKELAKQQEAIRIAQERQYTDALERFERSSPSSHERTAAQSTIRRLMNSNEEIAEREKERRAKVAAQERERLSGGCANVPMERQRQR